MSISRLTLDQIAASPLLTARFRSSAVELLEGREQRRALPSPALVAAVVRLAAAFDRDAYGLRVTVREAVAAPPHDLLRPDIGLLRPRAPRCAPAATPAAHLALAVLAAAHADEVGERLRRYALAGIAEVWVLSVVEALGVAYADPSAGRYRRRWLLLPGEPCAPEALPWARVVPLLRDDAATATPRRAGDLATAGAAPQPSASSSSSISKRSPATSITSPGTSRRLRRVSG